MNNLEIKIALYEKQISKLQHNLEKAQRELAESRTGKRTCPCCGGNVVSTERRLNGNSTCENAHGFPTAKIVFKEQ